MSPWTFWMRNIIILIIWVEIFAITGQRVQKTECRILMWYREKNIIFGISNIATNISMQNIMSHKMSCRVTISTTLAKSRTRKACCLTFAPSGTERQSFATALNKSLAWLRHLSPSPSPGFHELTLLTQPNSSGSGTCCISCRLVVQILAWWRALFECCRRAACIMTTTCKWLRIMLWIASYLSGRNIFHCPRFFAKKITP